MGLEQAVCHVHEITGSVPGPQEGVRQVGKIAESSYRVPRKAGRGLHVSGA